MQKIWLLFYNVIIVPLLYIAFRLAGLKNEKVRKGILGRKNWEGRLGKIISEIPNRNRIFLFHVVSVGELQQALPVIRLLKQEYPGISVGLSFFSPSGYEFYKPVPEIDFICYLPFDSYFQAKKYFQLIRPVCWIVVKHDIWLNHLYQCTKQDIPSVLLAATLPESSKRAKFPVRNFNRAFYSGFSKILPISEEDKERFSLIYDKPETMIVTGDTRYDQVVYRSRNAREKAGKLPFYSQNRTYFMLGSIWDSDESVVIPPTITILKAFPKISVLVTPHEPEEKILTSIEKRFSEAGIMTERLSRIKNKPNDSTRAVLIDSVGILAQAYSLSIAAYVGGSFGPGVHNVMEPAIMGIPVLFGPRHLNSLEAINMQKEGGGFAVNTGDEFESVLTELFNSADKMMEAGNSVKQFVLKNTGASERIITSMEQFFEDIISQNHTN